MRWIVGLLVGICTSVGYAAECAPIGGIEGVLRPGLVLVLGELHGTNESPAFARDVACHGVAAGLQVIVGVEILTGERERIDTFLDSEGTPADRKAVLAGAQWQGGYQDGRTSYAMLELLEGLRRLHAETSKIRVVPFDTGNAGGGQARDRGMGRTMAKAVEGAPEAVAIVLTGNMHSRHTRGRARNADYEPMAWVMKQSIGDRELLSLDVAHGGGSAWICTPECGITDLGGHRGDPRWTIDIDDETRTAGHHGLYHVGSITASPPAREGKPSPTRTAALSPPEPTDALGESSAPPAPMKAKGRSLDRRETVPGSLAVLRLRVRFTELEDAVLAARLPGRRR